MQYLFMITTYGARLFKKGLPKEKKKQGLEQTLALSLYSDRSIVIPHRWLVAMEISNDVISVRYRYHSVVTCHSHPVIARAAIDGAFILWYECHLRIVSIIVVNDGMPFAF